jgi:Bacterial protein of unknown function (Gcw_chp)
MANKTLAAVAIAFMAAGGALVPAVSQAQVAFNVGAVTDYRYRGISQSKLRPAVQGGVDYTAGGFYVGAWASSIKWTKELGGGGSVEIDLYGGYKGEITKGLNYDVGVLTYQYPGNDLKDITGETANTTEVYGALIYGPATLKYSHVVSNGLFGAPDSKNAARRPPALQGAGQRRRQLLGLRAGGVQGLQRPRAEPGRGRQLEDRRLVLHRQWQGPCQDDAGPRRQVQLLRRRKS